MFTEDNSIGVEFVEIFQKENFSIEKIEKFIDKKNSFSNNISKIKNELTEQKIVEIAKQKGEQIKSKLADLAEYVKDKGTPILENAVEEVRKSTVKVLKSTIKKLENNK